MRGIPVREVVVAEACFLAVFGIARPVVAGHVAVASSVGGAVEFRAGEDVVTVRKIAAAGNEAAAFVERIPEKKGELALPFRDLAVPTEPSNQYPCLDRVLSSVLMLAQHLAIRTKIRCNDTHITRHWITPFTFSVEHGAHTKRRGRAGQARRSLARVDGEAIKETVAAGGNQRALAAAA